MSNNQLTRVDQFKQILNSPEFRAKIANSQRENAGAFKTSMLDLYEGDDYLQKCDPTLVAMECMKAASLHLPLVKSLGFAYVVPYKNVPTFIIGYKGLIQLAQRTGQYRVINADAVYEGEYKGKNKLTGEIDFSGEKTSDNVVGYFAYFKMINGFEKTLYMTMLEVCNWAKKYSKSFNSNYSPWKTEFDKMAIKTVLRRLIGTYGIMTPEMQVAVDSDEKNAVDAEIKANANKVPLDNEKFREVSAEDNAPEKAETPPEGVDPETGEVTGPNPEEAPKAPEADF
jgi:recombination protein RecT